MKKFITKKAFTLIELLVVITIIGILATWATTVYTSQIQKARDSTRITDLDALKMSIEQVYHDDFIYPHSDEFYDKVSLYMDVIPWDPKNGESCNDLGWGTPVACAYSYIVDDDVNGMTYGAYEISTAFENSWNVTKKAANEFDAWNDSLRFEMGVGNSSSSATVDTEVQSLSGSIWICLPAWWNPTDSYDQIIINGNPTNPATNYCG